MTVEVEPYIGGAIVDTPFKLDTVWILFMIRYVTPDKYMTK